MKVNVAIKKPESKNGTNTLSGDFNWKNQRGIPNKSNSEIKS
ncbi:hypothetical protein SAMN05421832_13015 [Psychrobacillus psychrodurans]|nr:hypothetical protein SAMN05421832_13015 [Psychrobacillus psychrodurans]